MFNGSFHGTPSITVSRPEHTVPSGLPQAGRCIMRFDVEGPSDILLNVPREELQKATEEIFARFVKSLNEVR